MKKINTKPLKGKWFPFPDDKDISVLIKPFSLFNMNRMPSENIEEVNVAEFFDNFEYVCLDWKGLVDEDDSPLVCNTENKKVIYDYFQELVGFVIEQSMAMRSEIVSGESAKNLSKSPSGKTPKSEKSVVEIVSK